MQHKPKNFPDIYTNEDTGITFLALKWHKEVFHKMPKEFRLFYHINPHWIRENYPKYFIYPENFKE